MLGMGSLEILVILLIAFIVLGPQKMIEAARYLGEVVGQLRGVAKSIPHIDLDEGWEHAVVLYYVIDSDGDTIIYNERTESLTYTEKQRVSPKQGRVVIFDGRQYHTAEQPTKGTRCIVNYNLDYYDDDDDYDD